jgi:hypothetical protein
MSPQAVQAALVAPVFAIDWEYLSQAITDCCAEFKLGLLSPLATTSIRLFMRMI